MCIAQDCSVVGIAYLFTNTGTSAMNAHEHLNQFCNHFSRLTKFTLKIVISEDPSTDFRDFWENGLECEWLLSKKSFFQMKLSLRRNQHLWRIKRWEVKVKSHDKTCKHKHGFSWTTTINTFKMCFSGYFPFQPLQKEAAVERKSGFLCHLLRIIPISALVPSLY